MAARCSRLERHAGKLARAVLRGRGASNGLLLPDRLTAVVAQASTWDANGNLRDDGAKRYTYPDGTRKRRWGAAPRSRLWLAPPPAGRGRPA